MLIKCFALTRNDYYTIDRALKSFTEKEPVAVVNDLDVESLINKLESIAIETGLLTDKYTIHWRDIRTGEVQQKTEYYQKEAQVIIYCSQLTRNERGYIVYWYEKVEE